MTTFSLTILLLLLRNFPTSGVKDSVVVYHFKMCPVSARESSPPNHLCPPPLQFWCRWRRRHRSDAETSVLRYYSDNRSTWLRFLYHNIRWNVMIDGWALLSARLLLHTLTPWDVSSGFFSEQCKELEKGVGVGGAGVLFCQCLQHTSRLQDRRWTFYSDIKSTLEHINDEAYCNMPHICCTTAGYPKIMITIWLTTHSHASCRLDKA